MKIPTVERCCCFDIETGGKILGWLGIIFGSISSLLMLGALIFAISLSCKDIAEDPRLESFNEKFTSCAVLKTVVIIVLIIVLAFVLVYTFIDIFLIQGISSRNPGKVLPAVIIQGFQFVSVVANGIIGFSGEGIVSALIGGALTFYFFIVFYSIYVRIRDEKRTNQNIQFSQP